MTNESFIAAAKKAVTGCCIKSNSSFVYKHESCITLSLILR